MCGLDYSGIHFVDRLALNSQMATYLSLPSTGIKGVLCHVRHIRKQGPNLSAGKRKKEERVPGKQGLNGEWKKDRTEKDEVHFACRIPQRFCTLIPMFISVTVFISFWYNKL